MRYLAYLDRVFGDYRFSYESIKYGNIENSWLIHIFGWVSDILGSVSTQYIFLLFILVVGIICSWILSSNMTKSKLLRVGFVLFWISTPWLYSRGMRGQVRNIMSYMLMPFVVYAGWVYYDYRYEDSSIFTKKNLISSLRPIAASGLISITNIRYLPIVYIWFIVIIISKQFNDSGGSISALFTKQVALKLIGKITLYSLSVLLISSYWIIPFYHHLGGISFDAEDLNYFSPKGDWYHTILQLTTMSGQADENWALLYPAYLSKLPNLILSVLFLLILIYGLRKVKIDGFKKIILGFAIFSIIFGSGSSLSILSTINTFIINNIPGFNFYREPGKWLVWVVVLYGIFIWSLLDQIHYNNNSSRYLNIIGLGLIGIYIINNIYFYITNGFNSDKYISYPKGRYDARDRLSSDKLLDNRLTISLPRHWYLRCDFTNGSIIQNPVGVFFGPNVIYGDNMEAGGIYTNVDSDLGLFFASRYKNPQYYYNNPEGFLYKLRTLGVKNIIWLKNNCAKGDRMIDFIDKFDQASLGYYKVFENESVRVYDIK